MENAKWGAVGTIALPKASIARHAIEAPCGRFRGARAAACASRDSERGARRRRRSSRPAWTSRGARIFSNKWPSRTSSRPHKSQVTTRGWPHHIYSMSRHRSAGSTAQPRSRGRRADRREFKQLNEDSVTSGDVKTHGITGQSWVLGGRTLAPQAFRCRPVGPATP